MSTTSPQAEPVCGAVMGGSGTVAIERRAAGRLGDMGCVRPIDASETVRINGRPALRVGDRVYCPDGRIGVIVDGASSVKINGRAAATANSRIQGCD